MLVLVTLKDIAREVGLSDMAVSNALRGRGRLAEETRVRIQTVAKRLGYRPNASARSMSQGRFGCMTLLLSTQGEVSHLPAGLLDGVDIGLAKHDYHLNVARLPDTMLTSEGYMPKILREWSSDGLLINYQKHIPKAMVDMINHYRIPSVWINSKGKHDCAYIDDAGAGRLATEHLIALGHRRIGYVDFSHRVEDLDDHYSARDRRDGYTDAMTSAGLKPQYLMRTVPQDHADDRLGLATQFLRKPSRCTAVVCYSESNNATVMIVAALTLGLSIPKDLSVIGIEGAPMRLGMDITTVLLPMIQLGACAAEMVLEKVTKDRKQIPSRAVQATLYPGGQTTAAAPTRK